MFDGDGLYLFVQPNGGRWWRFKYRFHGKERELSLGVYPEVSLKLARTRREDARRAVAQGIDPSAERKAAKVARQVTFELIAEEWLALQTKKVATVTYDKARWMLSSFICPRLGSRPIAEITAPELLAALLVLEGARRTDRAVAQRPRHEPAGHGRRARHRAADLCPLRGGPHPHAGVTVAGDRADVRRHHR